MWCVVPISTVYDGIKGLDALLLFYVVIVPSVLGGLASLGAGGFLLLRRSRVRSPIAPAALAASLVSSGGLLATAWTCIHPYHWLPSVGFAVGGLLVLGVGVAGFRRNRRLAAPPLEA